MEMGVTRGGGDGTIIVRPGDEVTVVDISRHGNKGRGGMAYETSTLLAYILTPVTHSRPGAPLHI